MAPLFTFRGAILVVFIGHQYYFIMWTRLQLSVNYPYNHLFYKPILALRVVCFL